VSIRFANGTEGTISYLANGDRGVSKERLEIFGGGAVAVLEDFRQLELSRNGKKETIRSRWRQDKGHRAEWAAFVRSIRVPTAPAISFDDLVCSTLATLRVQESISMGQRVAVDTASFIDSALRGSSLHENG
jgi:predicted dehydrogenase